MALFTFSYRSNTQAQFNDIKSYIKDFKLVSLVDIRATNSGKCGTVYTKESLELMQLGFVFCKFSSNNIAVMVLPSDEVLEIIQLGAVYQNYKIDSLKITPTTDNSKAIVELSLNHKQSNISVIAGLLSNEQYSSLN